MTDDTPDTPEVQTSRPQIPRLGAASSGLVALLLAGAVFVIPFLGLFIAPLGSLPVLHFQAGGSPGYRAWGPVVALLVVATIGGFGAFALPLLGAYSLVVVLPSATVELWTRVRWSEGRWVMVATMAGLAAILATVVALSAPRTPMEAGAEWMRSSSETLAKVYAAWGESEGNAELLLDAAESTASWILPAGPVAYLVVILFWMRPRLPLLGLDVTVAAFEDFRNDEWLAALFALAGGGTLLLQGVARWVAINLLVAVLILYFVQGLAMIRAHLARFFGRGWLVRWGVALLCLQFPLPLLVAALGLADSFHPLRPQADDDGGTT